VLANNLVVLLSGQRGKRVKWLIELAVLLAILLGAAHIIDVAYGMQPLPLKADLRCTITKIAESHEGEVTYWKLVDPKSLVVCYITVGELHGWTLSQTCMPMTKDGRGFGG